MSLRIFLVDDNLVFLTAAQRFLEMLPQTSVTSLQITPGEVLPRIQAAKPDLVLVDVIPQNASHRALAKMLASSLVKTYFPGDVMIFRNTGAPLFLVERKGLEEVFIETPELHGSEAAEYSWEWKYRVAERIPADRYDRILFLDCDCLALRNLDHLLEGDPLAQTNYTDLINFKITMKFLLISISILLGAISLGFGDGNINLGKQSPKPSLSIVSFGSVYNRRLSPTDAAQFAAWKIFFEDSSEEKFILNWNLDKAVKSAQPTDEIADNRVIFSCSKYILTFDRLGNLGTVNGKNMKFDDNVRALFKARISTLEKSLHNSAQRE